jgi:protein-disulfide isomerase
LVLYGDFECPYSGKAFLSVKRLQEALPDELRFAYRHFPIVPKHKHAMMAAEASEAAAAQGRFWEYHDLLFNHQKELDEGSLVRYARELKLDEARFKQDLISHAFLSRIEEDRDDGEESGVFGTPTFFINGNIYEGYYEYRELYDAVIGEMRAKK